MFQTAHHDVWDYDLPSKPVLYDVPGDNGARIPALIQSTKRGEIFMLDRRTGVPIAEVVEKPVSTAGLPGEKLAPTQPYSVGMPQIRAMVTSQLGVPCTDPPFGMMTAIDLKTRKIAWQRSMGTVKELGPLGIRTGMPIPLGMPTLGGPVATAAGLVFFNGTADYYLRAMDVKTGKEVWKSPLPVGAQSTPLVFTSPETGKQFVVVTAGGGRTAPDRGDYIIAYALPEQAK